MPDIGIPRETAEFIPVPVYRDEELVLDGYDIAVTRWPGRPTTWEPATVADGKAGIAVAGLTPGTYQVWVRVSGTVVAAGTIEVY